MTEQRKNHIERLNDILRYGETPNGEDLEAVLWWELADAVAFIEAVDEAFEKGTDPQFVLNAIFVARARFEEGN